jgi:hypothetical protein
LPEQDITADQTFAFGMVLTTDPAGARGNIRFQPGGMAPDEPCPTLLAFAEAVARPGPLRWRGAGGKWSLEWP